MNTNNIKWENYSGEGATPERIKIVEKMLGVVFPEEYTEIVKKCDGGIPSKPCFDILDPESIAMVDGIGAFLEINHSEDEDMLETNMNPPEFFPEALVSFASTGGGDYICFDYRKGKHLTNPPIVYWCHECIVGEAIFFLANNFREFLEMLREPEELPD